MTEKEEKEFAVSITLKIKAKTEEEAKHGLITRIIKGEYAGSDITAQNIYNISYPSYHP